MGSFYVRSAAFYFLAGLLAQSAIVINEIHYNPDVKTERVEFVELYNTGPATVDLGGWQFADAIEYKFPAGTLVASNGYVVVAESPAALAAKFGYAGALGPYTNNLSAYGEKLTLRDSTGAVRDEVNYGAGFPWPTVGDAPGYSIELINPNLDNDLGGSWRASVKDSGQPAGTFTLIESNSTWKYFKGRSEASSPTTAWRQLNFDDSTWASGIAPIGYGENFVRTSLTDMRSNYTAVFFRKTFVVQDPSSISNLVLQALYDDGFKLWINGSNVLNANISANEVPFNGTAGVTREDNTYNTFNLRNPGAYLVAGTNIIVAQAHNVSISGSTDFFLDIRLQSQSGPTAWGPTPGRVNSVFATNAPPQIRQVAHAPEQPSSGQPVQITAKVTDPDGVASVTLQYQVVLPGQYIELADAAYATNWITVPMQDGGTNGDVTAGDDIFSATIPASVQQHRRLIRYRITVTDRLGLSVRVPYVDDPQPNFAYFVYNGAPEWRGAVQPGASGSTGVVFTVSSNAMNRLPMYHLIGKSNTIATATWFSRYAGDVYQWQGTLVYDGKVYDNVHFRARGGVWRYAMVKNSWKFDLNRGHEFEARDNWARKYKTKRKKIDLRASIQQADFLHRGEQGMFESLGYRLFQLADALAPDTTFVTLRVIDDAQETSNSQFESDFWGVYLAVEEQDGEFLDQHDLPDSNLYKMDAENGTPPAALNNLGPNGPIDKSDVAYIVNNYSNTNELWWRTNWNFANYYNWQTIVEAINDLDINAGKNYFYYFDPRTRLWEPMSWDLDLTWFHWLYGNPHVLATGILRATTATGTNANANTTVLRLTGSRPNVEREFKNRVREIRDLLFNTNETWRLIDEYAALLQGPTNGPTILDADRAQWDYNPKMIDTTYTSVAVKAGQGRFYQFPNESATNAALRGSFASAVQIMKNYVGIRSEHLDTLAADPAIPETPTITYTGPANFPSSRLSFRSSAFTSPFVTNQFGAIQWRVAKVSTNGPSYLETEPLTYEIESPWQLTNNSPILDLAVPASVVRVGSSYRARVRMWDATGRASHWSAPIEFTVGEPEAIADLLSYLRITEVMYNPPTGGYEYVELHNISDSLTLDLSGVKFTQGIDYTFPAGATLAPGGYLLVTKATANNNFAAFRAFYGLSTSVPVFGPFSGSLDNSGEQITLRTSAGGTDIVSFHYNDGRGWPQAADGAGHSLVILDSAELEEGAGSAEYGGNWRASTYPKGSPGRADNVLPPSILINEFAANTTYSDPAHPEFDSNDWIELYNATDADVSLSGWYLSDDAGWLSKWAIPTNITIPAHGFVAFDEVTGFHNPTNFGFGLSSDGEQIFLSYFPGTAENRIVDAVSFKAQASGVSLGRYPDGSPFWFALAPTRGESNAAPSLHVVLNEIQFHPPDIGGTNDNSLDEFIEIFNPTATSVSFSNGNGGWRLNGDVGFNFPTSLSLGAGEYLLLVNFNPATNAAQLAAFRGLYGLGNTSPAILGPYSNGKLPNSSARLALEQPLASSIPGTSVWMIVDEVIYADQYPWSCAADGTGNSFQRIDPLRHGSDPANWMAARPTAGAPPAPEPLPLPTFLAQPQSRAAGTNTDVTFRVAVCGTPPFAYQWRFEGNDIPGATNTVLTLRAVQLSDAGVYTLIISNNGGAVLSDPAVLSVQYPPLIVTQPESHSADLDASTAFTVEVIGSAPFQYQWRLNGANITGATNQTLSLSNLQLPDQGSYSVRVINAVGSVLSSPALLTLNLPARVAVPPQNVNTNPGVNVTFTVSATGSAPLFYQWRFQDEDIPDATNAALMIPNIVLENSGAYSVLVSNAYGSDVSAAAILNVLVEPVVREQPHGVTLAVGETAVFSVGTYGLQPMGFRWMRNGLTYVPFPQGSSNLVLTNVALTDAAQYKVGITNPASSGLIYSSNAFLTVVLPPTNQMVEVGSDVSIEAILAGFIVPGAPLQFAWEHNGVILFSTNQAGAGTTLVTNDLVLTNLAEADSGIYNLLVTNSTALGSNSSGTFVTAFPMRLTVSQPNPPIILDQPTNQFVKVGSNATFRVVAYGVDPMRYQWWFNQTNRIQDATNTSLVLLNVGSSNAGPYHVTISNPGGTSVSTDATLFVIYDPVPPESTNAVKLEAMLELGATNAVLIQFTAFSNRTYTVEAASDPAGTWTNLLSIPPKASNRTIIWTNTFSETGPQGFFRVATPGGP